MNNPIPKLAGLAVEAVLIILVAFGLTILVPYLATVRDSSIVFVGGLLTVAFVGWIIFWLWRMFHLTEG